MSDIPVEDRLEIQELAARYVFRCDTARYDEVGELFAEDGVWDETVVGLPLCEGRPAIHEFFSSMAQADLEWMIHVLGSQQLTQFDRDTASGTYHLHVEGVFNGNAVRILGYYADDYVKVDGRWLFKHRKLVEIAPSTGFEVAAAAAEAGQS
jgi:SnoaL-like domain